MNINIKINKDGLTINQCRKLSEYLQSFNTIDIISLLEGDKHICQINDNILVEIKRNYYNK
tara:strand:+ start:43 stop:225 length:183 start_codon:yes stop_codon:yes gene_type:complete